MEEKNQASVGLIILSILFPIVGIILYFVKKMKRMVLQVFILDVL